MDATIQRHAAKSTERSFMFLAFLGLGGGMLFILLGFFCIILHSAISQDDLFNNLGTILMILAFPLMILGGHFMDKASSKK